MKSKIILTIAVSALFVSLTSCNKKSPEQLANESLEREKQEQYHHKVYIDSLVNVAVGLEGVENTVERQNALDTLIHEYPEMKERWYGIQESINNMEVYGDSENE
nr:hypothetical protein [Prevotella sp.]